MVGLAKEWAEWGRSDIEWHAPAVYATGHDGKRSSRYTFVSSEKVIEAFSDAGWGVAGAQQDTARRVERMRHGKHILRFRPRDKDLVLRDPRGAGTVYPEIVCLNSSDGSCRWHLESGAFATVCSNGLWVRVPGFEMAADEHSRRHYSFDPELAYAAANRMVGSFDKLRDTVTEMAETELPPAERAKMAVEAWHWRHPDWPALGRLKGAPVLLTERRPEDSRHDLWTTYNVIQENCIRGGHRLSVHRVRPISNVARTRKLNAALWRIAERALERSRPQT